MLARLGSCLKGVMESWNKTDRMVSANAGISSDSELLNFTTDFIEWFAWLFQQDDELDDSLENFPALM